MIAVSDEFNDDKFVDIRWNIDNNIGFTDSSTVFRRIHFTIDPWDSLARVFSTDEL